MPARAYRTLAVALVEYADAAGDHFETAGYKLRVEHDHLGFPYTPTFVLKRPPTTIVLEVNNVIQMDRLKDWVRYGKSCGADTRVAVCVPNSVILPGEDIEKLREHGIGLYVAHKDRLVEQLLPGDLALNVQLPDRAALPQRVRELLGSAYDQFGRTQWREGFQDACQVLEFQARNYLKKWSKTGRIRVLRKGVPVVLFAAQINKMTMGQLAHTFGKIQAQNYADSTIHKALMSLNKDRVALTHHKTKAWTEKRLRTNVGQHMWTIVAALKVTI